MDKVEKFKELLEEYANSWYLCCAYDLNTKKDSTHKNKKDKLINKMVKLEKELIKMYEEKQEKPVIRCKELYVKTNPKYGYEIQFINLKNHEVKTYKGTLSCKEKDGMLITDDFIFLKEALNEKNI